MTPDEAEARVLREFLQTLADPEDSAAAGYDVPRWLKEEAAIVLLLADAARVIAEERT